MGSTPSTQGNHPGVTMYNTDLMLAIRAQIVSDPESHDQTRWGADEDHTGREAIHICGTVRCIAGWAAALSGKKTILAGDAWGASVLVDGRPIDQWAADALGLTADEASSLFFELYNDEALRKLDRLIEKAKGQ